MRKLGTTKVIEKQVQVKPMVGFTSTEKHIVIIRAKFKIKRHDLKNVQDMI